MKWIVASFLVALVYSPALADKTIDGWSPPIEAEVVPPVRVSAPPPNPHYGEPAARSSHWYGGITILGASAPDQHLKHDVHGRDFSVDVDLSEIGGQVYLGRQFDLERTYWAVELEIGTLNASGSRVSSCGGGFCDGRVCGDDARRGVLRPVQREHCGFSQRRLSSHSEAQAHRSLDDLSQHAAR